ncbi:ATP-binding cassette domain-containing protein [Amycolatopsis acidicola]|uniref:ATP-binding cassette domain-containing protein n=1 Tax=Amycolatopsis acidicola TaxID=2596893 RepID=A0A5N0UPX8_9PSEU|nr:ATP-binding cassette domain-containing protein [Amycolatopsis acidicola]KAA9153181.1 ATP-binding cassette domain-containing protein [Amycolatopsis acidicola]
MDATIEVRGLRKRYGTAVALDDLTFTVSPGHVTGFGGPAGAGKTTTLRVLLGLERPDRGMALISGRQYRELRVPLREAGAVLWGTAPHPACRARTHLRWLAQSNGLPATRAGEVLELTGLSAVAKRAIGTLDPASRRRLDLAAALLGDPPVLLLDEPFDGLGPDDATWLRGLLRELAAQGRAVLITSRTMRELEETAEHVVVVTRGRLLADAPLKDLLAAVSDGLVAVHTSHREEAITVLAHAGATVTAGGGDEITVSGLPADRVVSVLSEGVVPFSGVSEHRPSLEEAYLELTRKTAEQVPA